MASTVVIDSICGEFERYQSMAERVYSQLSSAQLCGGPGGSGNSIATLAFHIGGNLKSRFTDFLSSDGEKPWRRREDEFSPRFAHRDVLFTEWKEGWAVLFATLATLDDSHLPQTVQIRGSDLQVVEALHRALAHVAYHVGQMVSCGRTIRGSEWEFLTIPPGETDRYNQSPLLEKPSDFRQN